MLHHLLAGRMPEPDFGQGAARPSAGASARRALPALAEVAPSTPAELEAICEQATAWEPADRYADMSALAQDLCAYLEGRVVAAYETGAPARAVAVLPVEVRDDARAVAAADEPQPEPLPAVRIGADAAATGRAGELV